MAEEGWKSAISAVALPFLVLTVFVVWSETPTNMTRLNAGFAPSGASGALEDSIFDELPLEHAASPEVEMPETISYSYERTVPAKITGYTPGPESCGPFADGYTSTGSNAWVEWGVAADPAVLPYGSIVFIPGVGYREVDDTGSAMRKAWGEQKKVHIDLRFKDLDEALRWGVRNLNVHIFLPESRD